MTATRRTALVLVLVLVLAGCRPGGGGELTVADSAGVLVVRVPPAPAARAWSLADAPAAVIGDGAAGADYELYQPLHALRLDDGRLVVANQGTQEVRFYTGDGRYLQTVGGRGSGPGEFQDMWGLARLSGDSLGAWDFSARRLTVFDDTGGLARVVTPVVDLGFVPRLLGALGDGGVLIARGMDPGVLFARGSGVMEDSVMLLRLTPADGAVLDSLGPFPGDQRFLELGEGQFWIRAVPFGRSERLAVGGGRLHVGDDRSGDIRSYDADGGLTRIVRLTGRDRPVTQERLGRLVETRLDGVPADARQLERRRLRQIPPAESLPVFADLFADRLGRVWIREQDDDGAADATWLVLPPEGRPAAALRLPARARPLDAGADYVLLYARDDDDIERVLLHSLRTTEGDMDAAR